MTIEVTQCSMCIHYNTEQYCEVWEQYITNDTFYCACGVEADRKTEPTVYKMREPTEEEKQAILDCVKTEPTGYNLSPVEDEPQTERSRRNEALRCQRR